MEVIKRARKRLFCLSQLKRVGLGPNELAQFYRTCIRPIKVYACPVCHDGLPVNFSRELEAVQKRAMRTILLCFLYDEALVKTSLVTLSERRQALTAKLFKKQRQQAPFRHGLLLNNKTIGSRFCARSYYLSVGYDHCNKHGLCQWLNQRQ